MPVTFIGGPGKAFPIVETAGAGASALNAGTVDVPYPATVNANDILILHFYARETTGGTAIGTPAGWTALTAVVDSGGSDVVVSQIFWKRAAGTETGNLTVTATYGGTSSRVLGGRIYRFSGCQMSGTPFENSAGGFATASTTHSQRSIASTGFYEVLCHFTALVLTSEAMAAFTGESNGDFTEAFEYQAGVNRFTMQLQTVNAPTPVTVSGGSATITSSAYMTHVLALLPV